MRPQSEPGAAGEDAADRRDVRRTLQGEGAAYAELVERHQGRVAQQMWRFTRDPDEHRELVQDVFVNAYLGLSGYRGDGPFEHWLRKIAVRTGYAFWRARRRRRTDAARLDDGLLAALASQPEDNSPQEAAELVQGLLARLPLRDRAVLTLFYLEERSIEQIADDLGWGRSMVKVHLWRARNRLRRMLDRLQAQGGGGPRQPAAPGG